MTALVARLVLPFSIVVGFALWSRGYSSIGDGFSAGAVAGLGAVAQYVLLDYGEAKRRTLANYALQLLAAGLFLCLAVALAPLVWGQPPVTHLPRPDGKPVALGVLKFHSATLFDLAVAISVYGAVTGTFDRLLSRKADRPGAGGS